MKQRSNRRKDRGGRALLLSIVLIFCALGATVYTVARKASQEMSSSAIQNLSESLDLLQCTIEAILNNEAEFQGVIAQELARTEDPEGYILTHAGNQGSPLPQRDWTSPQEGP